VFIPASDEQINFDYTPSDNTQAYENVLYNLYVGDHSRFISADVALEALRIVTPALEADVPLKSYGAGCDPSNI
jgi:glucose-6-phosphate 1-dehydrogenase